jgi:hypothetical protein
MELQLSLDLVGAGSFDARGLVDAVANMHMEISRAAVGIA